MTPSRRSKDHSDEPSLIAAERKAAERRRQAQRKHRLLRIGQVLMLVGSIVAIVHVLAHLQMLGGEPSYTVDLVAGYPMAGLLFVAGGIMAGQ